MNREPPTIEHNPNEKRETNAIWWVLLALIVFSWVCYFVLRAPDWWSISLGAGTGMIFILWGIEFTGNKVPDSWRR